MLIALDENDSRIFIDDTIIKREYYCSSCGAPLVQRKEWFLGKDEDTGL